MAEYLMQPGDGPYDPDMPHTGPVLSKSAGYTVGSPIHTPTPLQHVTVDGSLIADLDEMVTVHGQYLSARDAQAAGLIGCYAEGDNVRFRILGSGEERTNLTD